eukprot:1513432-Lingulodinium_polyedra.AAC.1
MPLADPWPTLSVPGIAHRCVDHALALLAGWPHRRSGWCRAQRRGPYNQMCLQACCAVHGSTCP